MRFRNLSLQLVQLLAIYTTGDSLCYLAFHTMGFLSLLFCPALGFCYTSVHLKKAPWGIIRGWCGHALHLDCLGHAD